jgi:CRP-like cAMP-binding protein
VPQSPNLLLNALPPDTFAALQPHLKIAGLPFGNVLAESGEEIQHVYFPYTGVVSLVVEMSVGDMIETAMVGRNGVVNAAWALDGKISLNKAIVQVAGSAALLNPGVLRKFAAANDTFHGLLIRHEQIVLAQAQQSAGCNAGHLVEARLSRWLLMMRDLTQSDDLKLTQEFLAQMLGVRRTSVSLVASTLQKAGLIRYSRGNIRILDVEKLRAGACECYERVKSHYDRLFDH